MNYTISNMRVTQNGNNGLIAHYNLKEGDGKEYHVVRTETKKIIHPKNLPFQLLNK